LPIGLAVALLAAWLYHGPYGGGERFISALEQRAQLRLRFAELPGISVRMQREPLARVALLSGEANDFQRQGMGSFPGIDDRMLTIPGMAAIRWNDEPGGRALPLLAETMLLAALAWSIGLAIGWLLFGRKKRESFLGDEEFYT
jgi:hypothetical protein